MSHPVFQTEKPNWPLCKFSCDHCGHGDQGLCCVGFACSPHGCISSLWPPSSLQSPMTCNWGNWLLLKIDIRCLSWCTPTTPTPLPPPIRSLYLRTSAEKGGIWDILGNKYIFIHKVSLLEMETMVKPIYLVDKYEFDEGQIAIIGKDGGRQATQPIAQDF